MPLGRGVRHVPRLGSLAVGTLMVVLGAGCAVDLGTLGGDFSQANDINDHGVVVGFAFTAGQEQHAYRQAPGHRKVDLNGDFERSEAVAVNSSGVAVGFSTDGEGVARAVLWDRHGVAHDLGVGDGSQATDINDHGVVVGNVTSPAVSQLGWVWDPRSGEVEMLPHAWPGGEDYQQAEAINDAGTIVGNETEPPSGTTMGAVMWTGPDHRPVGLAGSPLDPYAFARDINERGDIVGATTGGPSGDRATVWLAPAYQPLDITPTDSWYGSAFGINDRRQVVGLVGETDHREWAFRWDARTGRLVDLGGLGGTTARALAINDRGIAVGYAETGEVNANGSLISHAAAFVTPPRR
jgi:probable HAF family extracellular repeat protein